MSKKVSEFNDASLPLSGNEFIPIVQNGLNRKTPISEIKGDVESVNGKTGEIVLNADDIDDGNTTNKFATDEQLAQIETNESDISSINIAQGVQDGLISDLRTDVDTNASDLEGVKTKTDDTISYKYIPSSFDFLNIPLGYDNSIWEIRYDFDLETNSVTIPENVTLYFKGGSFSNGELIGDKTKIDANLDYIFKEDLDLSGDFSVENVKSSWFGVKDVSNFDNSENLQKAIFVKENVRINKGTYYINETIQSIESKANQGISIFGNNNSVTDPVYDSTARNETSTSLLWNGLDGGTMFNFKNTINLLLENIVLHGNNKAGVLAHFTTDNTLANAVNSFKNCSLYNADVLVKFGELSTDGTCSDFYFLKSKFTNATYGIQVLNHQGLNYHLNQVSASNIESVVKMDRGGHINMNMCNFVNTGSDANGNYSIHIDNSDNNAFSTLVTGIRFEQNSDNFIYARGLGDTKITGLTEAQSSSTTNKIKLRGHSLVIEDSRISSWDNLVDLDFFSGVNPYITFRNTYFSSIKTFEDIKDMFVINTDSPVYISIENCTIKNSSGTAKTFLSNFYSSALLGEVVHYVTIIGASVSDNAYLFGETSQNRYNTIELPEGISSIKTEIVGEDLGNGDFLGATLIARVHWDGTTATILSSDITDIFTTGTSTFNTAYYVSSIIGCRVRITNSTGTIKYTCKTKIL